MALAPSPTARPTRRRLPLLAAAAVAAAGVVVVVLLATATHRTHVVPGRLDDQPLVGSTARPALQSQGIPVKVLLPHGSVLATVTGPETPGQGLPVQQTYDTTTWTVHLSGATTTVPLALSQFDTLDHGGVVGHPVLVPDTPAPPATLRPGQSVTFQIREQMVIGEGLMRYAPDGTHIEAKWDFEVEND